MHKNDCDFDNRKENTNWEEHIGQNLNSPLCMIKKSEGK